LRGTEPAPGEQASTGKEPGFAAGTRPVEAGQVSVGADAVGTPVVDVPADGWVAAATCARDQLGMDYLDWLSAVDEPEGDPAGLDVVLHLAATDSFGTGHRTVRRLLLRTRVPNSDPTLPSLTSLWPGVAWHERETFEMFGLTFTGFEDGTAAGLRPLLLPDGFEGTPLRKSFVLAARAAKAWPGAKDPGDSGAKAPSRRKTMPPGVPDPSWGPHVPGEPREEALPARPARAPRAGTTGRPARTARAARAAGSANAPSSPAPAGNDTSASSASSAEPAEPAPDPDA
jgi:NADH:ubiquinone oxidoreductase subunit C